MRSLKEIPHCGPKTHRMIWLWIDLLIKFADRTEIFHFAELHLRDDELEVSMTPPLHVFQVCCQNHRGDGTVLPCRNNQTFFKPPHSTHSHL